MIQIAKIRGLGDKAEERLFRAYFTEGKDFGDPAVLAELGTEIGLSTDDVGEALSKPEYAEKVRSDIREAQEIGINGVPFFVFDRKYGVSGAQPPQTFVQVLEKSFGEWKGTQPVLKMESGEGPSCGPDGNC